MGRNLDENELNRQLAELEKKREKKKKEYDDAIKKLKEQEKKLNKKREIVDAKKKKDLQEKLTDLFIEIYGEDWSGAGFEEFKSIIYSRKKKLK